MKPAPFSLRTLFIANVTMVVTLSVIGWGVWSLAAADYRHVIDTWIAMGRTAGYQISFDDRQMFGFPRHITMRLKNLHWKNSDGIDFRTDDVDIQVTPWRWWHYEAKFKHNVVVTAPLDREGRALTLAARSGWAEVEVQPGGEWRSARLELDDAEGGVAPSYLFHAGQLGASVLRPDTQPTDHSQTGLKVTAQAEDISVPNAIPSPFGPQVDSLTTTMRVMGRVPDIRKRAAVDLWNKDSGILEFDDLSLRWGVLDLVSKGTLGFDDELQPEGAFAARVVAPEKAFHALVDKGFIAMHDADMLAAVTDMFSKMGKGDGKGAQIPITVQLGGLFFGPIRIFTFPLIDWPVAPPPVQ